MLPLAEEAFAGQSVQAAEPVVSLYVDATHAAHAMPVYPALHRQPVERVLPTGPTEFAGHAEQRPLPMTDLYVFTAHAVQGLPFAP